MTVREFAAARLKEICKRRQARASSHLSVADRQGQLPQELAPSRWTTTRKGLSSPQVAPTSKGLSLGRSRWVAISS